MSSEAIEQYHKARSAGVTFSLGADGQWIAHCEQSLWDTWRPAIAEHWPIIARSLRPSMAANRQAAANVIRQSPEAWTLAGQVIERSKRAAAPISGDGRTNTPPQAARPAKP